MRKASSSSCWASTLKVVLSLLGTLIELATKAVKLWQSIHR